MKKRHLYYISPSILPSRSANSIHVVMQCKALSLLGLQVTLFAKRTVLNNRLALEKIRRTYGVDFCSSGINLISYYSKSVKAVNIRIACMAVKQVLTNRINPKNKGTVILSRNLYASFVLGVVFRIPIFFETHQLEYGFKKKLQKLLIRASWVSMIVISQKLVECLQEHHQCKIERPLVLHDAAPDGIKPAIRNGNRRIQLCGFLAKSTQIEIENWELVCGYFGHLYQGRGLELIEQVAIRRPNMLFLVVGGNPEDVVKRTEKLSLKNIIYLGYVPHPVAQKIMKLVDVLLMPYQNSVSIGTIGHDTAKWMSPMKMFEYMASGVPLISSNLPVLCEILRDGHNALLVKSNSARDWVRALDKLYSDYDFAMALGSQAHKDYKEKHTWNQRASKILESVTVS